jgi:glycosyltransferase involved in cell wall biosynthesis
MRILHVINGLGTGGAERSLAELLPYFTAAGVESSIVCLAHKPNGVHEAVVRAGYDVQVVGTDRVQAAWRIRQIVRRRHPDIVHTAIFDADVLGRLAAMGLHTRVVSSLVNTYGEMGVADPTVSSRKLAAVRHVDGLTARHLTDHFHAISGVVKESAVEYLGLPPQKVTVVERGRELGRLGDPSPARRIRVRRALGISEDAEVVLNLGRQEPQKDQATLIRAMIRLAPNRPRLVLVQAGRPGKSTRELHRLVINSGLPLRVLFLGHRDDAGDLFAAADVFAFPSVYEGLGGSVLEAMAMRVPVVVSDVPALLDVTGHGAGGTRVPVGDDAALAVGIERLLVDPEQAHAQAERARRIFEERFTLERSVMGMLALYETVLGQRGH